ncbi:MAG: endonuclease domain-containing protein [Tabrizicola sp.]
MSGFQNMNQKAQAKRLRRTMTQAERVLWTHLRAHRFNGLSVRRQAPIGPFIVDFLIPDYRLVIEADGTGHGSQRDTDRDRWLSQKGFRVLRLGNRDILTNLPACLDTIAAHTPEH